MSSSLIFTLMLYEHKHLPSSCCFFTPLSTPSLSLLKISVLCGRNALIRCLSGLGCCIFARAWRYCETQTAAQPHNLESQQGQGRQTRSKDGSWHGAQGCGNTDGNKQGKICLRWRRTGGSEEQPSQSRQIKRGEGDVPAQPAARSLPGLPARTWSQHRCDGWHGMEQGPCSTP